MAHILLSVVIIPIKLLRMLVMMWIVVTLVVLLLEMVLLLLLLQVMRWRSCIVAPTTTCTADEIRLRW